ncbi:alpha/beta hydrolase [Streptomyces sp. Je 1-4]|uniref:alpha/beta hydrolase n=1 Tax=Streptomyces TaxID=1883 RepID=UPI0021D81E09|nr:MULTISPECIES: alpha/beta hydrolase [unclassified Streptomyces]UYB39086.1 alpha/beta hydrolase [Streptomyces sp. Je 1-4]UZQ35089.1 alpha/beta hydrolase [Streptomyces sp. Je 1-4] [Streptomyces sp. Je 1-4 4N24]UZQ42507.1 alpha/beta hydrolase [Streptomyces sp. Je 1-4] [Streptomyces sp. Je 1-4 4N24_ara]
MRGSTTTWRRCTLAVLMAAVALTTAGPVSGSAEAATSTRSPALIPASDRQVRFTADGTTAYGTVHIPAHRAGHRLAAALLIPGSGLTDRNGDQPPASTPHTLALFASTLGDDGVMSMRFDKYGTGRTGWGRYQNSDHIDMAAYTRQAVAAYNTLRAQPEAAPNGLLIVGHSEGGLQALLVSRTVRPKPAGLALIAPQATRLLDAVDDQLAGILDRLVTSGELSPQQAQLNKAGVSRAIADFRAKRQVDTSGLLPFVDSLLNGMFGPHNATFVRSDDAIYPPDIARRVARGTRTLVTCGTADTNVPCRTTPPLLAALATAHTTGPGLRILPGLDHYLHPAGTPANDQMIAPAAQSALHDFVRPWRRLTAS